MTTTALDHVTKAALDSYQAHRMYAVVQSWADVSGAESHCTAIVVPGLSLAECFVDDGDFESMAAGIVALHEEGWTVSIVVACSRLGEAHQRLRGYPATVQGWWEEAGTIEFTRPERL